MKSLKTLVSLSALAVCMGAASMANAVSLSPLNTGFTATGTIVTKSPSSFQIPITCNVTFTGSVNSAGLGIITSAVVSGSSDVCSYPQTSPYLPWTLTATSLSGAAALGTVAGVGFNINHAPLPVTTCGPSVISVGYSNTTHVLTASGQAVAPNCTVQTLNVTVTSATSTPITVVP